MDECEMKPILTPEQEDAVREAEELAALAADQQGEESMSKNGMILNEGHVRDRYANDAEFNRFVDAIAGLTWGAGFDTDDLAEAWKVARACKAPHFWEALAASLEAAAVDEEDYGEQDDAESANIVSGYDAKSIRRKYLSVDDWSFKPEVEMNESGARQFLLGSEVRRKSDGQVMFVESVIDADRVRCRWIKPSGLVVTEDIAVDSLEAMP